MVETQLRKTMGGYKRADVQSYIDALVQKYEKELECAREEAATAGRETEAALRENAKLFEELSALRAERDSVSRAVIAAQKEADEILTRAREEGEQLLEKKRAEIKSEEERLSDLREEIRSLRLSAAASLRKYEASLGEILPGEKAE